MEFTTSYIAIIAAALVIGAVAGYIFAQSKTEETITLETPNKGGEIDDLKLSLAAQFDQNAATTAQLAKTVELLKQQVITNAREYSDLDVSGHFATDLEAGAAQPPRDWAPKPANAIGTLSEEYGLKEESVSAK